MSNRIRRVLIGVLGALLVALGFYDGVSAADITITGKAPTTNSDGSALTDLVSVRVYKAFVSSVAGCATATYSVFATVPVSTPGANFSAVDTNQTQNGVYCYKATALDAVGNESVFSNTASKTLDLLAPAAPTITQVN